MALPLPLVLLPFFGSGFVSPESMPAGLAWFAEHQPFTPIMDTLRGLLLGTPIGSSGLVSVAWGMGIALGGYLWSRKLYDRDPVGIARLCRHRGSLASPAADEPHLPVPSRYRAGRPGRHQPRLRGGLDRPARA